MSQARIDQLLNFIQEDSQDPFPKYALALEYISIDKQKSRELFEQLLANHPDYIGTYYHAANLFAELGDEEVAEKTFVNGIAKAKQLKEMHALKELQSAYMNFQIGDD